MYDIVFIVPVVLLVATTVRRARYFDNVDYL